ncbi:MAG: hypothetical protein HY538_09030 [Deltaproteobacteria bacterium]|nr:hypothetical protein [Deltaproteobacteria bacterium]
MEMMREKMEMALGWFREGDTKPEFVCSTRDSFQGRLDSMYRNFSKKVKKEDEVALLTAIVGEIGNNCFDHNLGQWRGVAGCYFQHEIEQDLVGVWVADRGQGVLSSLRQTVISLKDDEEALEIAFHQRLSGRSPEKRGNGLKFVRSVINGNDHRGLLFISGKAFRLFGGLSSSLKMILGKGPVHGTGTFALILWRIEHENRD